MSEGSSYASCLRAVLMHHVWGQFLCSMSAGSSYASCLRLLFRVIKFLEYLALEKQIKFNIWIWIIEFLSTTVPSWACLRAVLIHHVCRQFYCIMSEGSSYASCLRAVLMHHVWGQFLCIMSEGSSYAACLRAVLMHHVWGYYFGLLNFLNIWPSKSK